MMNLDFTDVENPFELAPEGDYIFLIEDAEIKPSKNNPADNLVIKWSIVNYEGPGNGKGMEWFHLGENSLWNLKLFLEALSGEVVTTLNDFDEADLVGMAFGASLRHDAEGKFQNLTGFVTS